MNSPKVGRILLEQERAARMPDEGAATIHSEELRSAFAISQEHVLTAWHCVRDAVACGDPLWFRLRDSGDQGHRGYKYLPVRLLDSDEMFDVAVLVVDGPRLGEVGLSRGEAAALMGRSIIPLGVDVFAHERVLVMGFPANAPSAADSDTVPAMVVDPALPLGEVTGLKLFGESFASGDPVNPRGLSGGPVLKSGTGARGMDIAVGVVRGVPKGKEEDTALGGGLIATRIADIAERLPQIASALRTAMPGKEEIVTYLTVLIDWLNCDPWPQDRRFDGPVLAPAAIERKLRVTTTGRAGVQELDADGLTRQYQRLVVLGGPGSGKTWLAKRTVRQCADHALQALAEGAPVDEVELPLYTTCSAFYSADGNVRPAAVSSALNQLPDLGGSRIIAALQVLFTERTAPTLLVIDSLDEAQGPHERLRQADTLPWRIVLTSRPRSWNGQLAVDARDGAHQVGLLMPLRYPDDIAPFIRRWFADRPSWGDDLAARIAQNDALQQAVTVPLILTFYCIIAGEGPLPDYRRDLYGRVVRCMLTGRWRDSGERDPDVDTCLQTLREWAWLGAMSDPVTGIGHWPDQISTQRTQLSDADRDALDHVAAPLGPPDLRTGLILRRFIHRSIREHLVAEHVAMNMTAGEAASELLSHIWYDPDWEYTAPAALVIHPARDQVLHELICRAADSDQIPADISVIDADREFSRYLARVAMESSETAWSDASFSVISKARLDLAKAERLGNLNHTTGWGNSKGQIRETMLSEMMHLNFSTGAEKLAEKLTKLDPPATAGELQQIRAMLLGLLSQESHGVAAMGVARVVATLSPRADDLHRARQALLRLLAVETNAYWVRELAGAIAALDPTREERRQARQLLVRMLGTQANVMADSYFTQALAGLASTAEERRHVRGILFGLPAQETQGPEDIAELIAGLDPTEEELRQIRKALLRRLSSATGSRSINDSLRVRLLARLKPTAEERQQALRVQLKLLAGRDRFTVAARSLGTDATLLAVTPEEIRRLREALLEVLAHETVGTEASDLAVVVAGLDPTQEDRSQIRDILLALLAQQDSWYEAGKLAGTVAQFAGTVAERGLVREALLTVLTRQSGPWEPRGREVALYEIGNASVSLAATAEERQDVREALLGLLSKEPSENLANIVADLDPRPEELRLIRGALLKLLARKPAARGAFMLTSKLAALKPTVEELREGRQALLRQLAKETYDSDAADLAGAVLYLDPTAKELRQVRQALLSRLPKKHDRPPYTSSLVAIRLVNTIARLDPTTEELGRARQALLVLLPRQAVRDATKLADEIALLDPTVEDLAGWQSWWQSWAAPPPTKLLAAARRNSPIRTWLAALRSMSSPPA